MVAIPVISAMWTRVSAKLLGFWLISMWQFRLYWPPCLASGYLVIPKTLSRAKARFDVCFLPRAYAPEFENRKAR